MNEIVVPSLAEFELGLTEFKHKFPLKEIKFAFDNQELVIPLLLRYLERAVNENELLDNSYMGHLFALYLLAQFKESQAFPLVMKLCKLPYKKQDALLGDCLTEDLSKFIAGTFDGSLNKIKEIVENSSVNCFVRDHALSSFLILVNEGRIQEEDLHNYSIELFNCFSNLNDTDGITMLVNLWADIDASKYLDEITLAFKKGLVNEDVVTLECIIDEIDNDLTKIYKEKGRYQPIINTINEMSFWPCFDKDNGMYDRKYNDIFHDAFDEHHHHNGCNSNHTITYTEPKIGRNDPCHCGSGKKFKKCCLS